MAAEARRRSGAGARIAGGLRARARRQDARRVAWTLVALLCSLATLAPLAWIVTTSLRTSREVAFDPIGLPAEPVWTNYVDAWTTADFGRLFVNSSLVAAGTIVGVLVLSTIAAYAFAVLPVPGRAALFSFFVAGLIVPIGLLVVPLFYEMRSLGLLNTLWALVLPQVAISLPFAIVLLRAFIADIPREILDAARVDGSGSFHLFRTIVLPLIKPAIMALIVFDVVWSWNQFLLPLVLTQDPRAHTLPLGLSFFMGRYAVDFPRLMAGATISIVPTVVIFVLFQRHMIRGITSGAFR
jgi:raffinose/stachyose/melibiose transport system permease protein